MKRKIALLAAAIAAVVMMMGPAGQASTAPPGTIVFRGNLCILDEANSVGYCPNVHDGNTPNGAILQNWSRNAQGEPNNDWTEFKVGVVDINGNNGAGYPWPRTLIALGVNEPYDTVYAGEWVVMIAWSPFNNPSNFCLAEQVAHPNGSGYAVGWQCGASFLDQLWVPSGVGQYTNVRGTQTLSLDGEAGEMDLEGEYTNGGTVGIELGVPPNNDVYAFQDYHWYPRYGT